MPHSSDPDLHALMQPVLTAAAMREADRYTIKDYGIPGFTLMETAGRGAVDSIEQHFGLVAGKQILCLCGKGNNGGDGFVVARVMHARGAHVYVLALAPPEKMSKDAALNWHLLERLADEDPPGRLNLILFEKLAQLAALPAVDLYVDALLGTGLTSTLRAPILDFVQWVNDRRPPVVALDVPTGLNSDTGCILGDAVGASLTVAMGALKAGLLINKGPEVAGQIETVEIGIPRFVLDQVGSPQQPGCALRPTNASIRSCLPTRNRQAHKYSAGLALVIAGAPGMTGAPVMAATAAARAGAGFVVCACPATIQPTLATKLTEVTTLALPVTSGGGIDPQLAMDVLAPRLAKAQAVLIGPGLGQHPGTQQFIGMLLEQIEVPAVVDADGLNALTAMPDMLTKHTQDRWILTPHAGEFTRLAQDDVDLTDRIQVVQDYARKWNSTLLLKGMPSIVGSPHGAAYINATGNPALATAGTGDVLAGLCVGFLAQGLSPLQATLCALHLGGAAADLYTDRYPATSMMAMDLLDYFPAALQDMLA